MGLFGLNIFILFGLILVRTLAFGDDNDDLYFSLPSVENLRLKGQKCIFPHLPVYESAMLQLREKEKIKCGFKEEDWVKVSGSTAYIDINAILLHGGITCQYRDIFLNPDSSIRYGKRKVTYENYILKTSDFVDVECQANDYRRWDNVLLGARENVAESVQGGWGMLSPESIPMNIVIIGFNAHSRKSFINNFPESYNYLKFELDAFELEGFNVVEDPSQQNLIAMLTGKSVQEIRNAQNDMKMKTPFPFVWKEFSRNGYVTAFLEDMLSLRTLNDRLKDFEDFPTDYSMLPYFTHVHSTKLSAHSCIGSRPHHKVILDYIRNMLPAHKEKPTFIVGFPTELSSNLKKPLSAMDDDFFNWLKWFNSEDNLNSTMLIVMSDYAASEENFPTLKEKLEHRLPFFSIVLPNSFKNKYQAAVDNLRTNAKRLTTPFDVHATFQDILKAPKEGFEGEGNLTQRGISLFREIPKERFCDNASIGQRWCTCLNWNEIDTNDKIARKGVLESVDFINSYNLKYTDKCVKLSLDRVLAVFRLQPNIELIKYQLKDNTEIESINVLRKVNYQIKFTTTPGNAVFEVTFLHIPKSDQYILEITDVQRVDDKKDQIRCLNKTEEYLTDFCACK